MEINTCASAVPIKPSLSKATTSRLKKEHLLGKKGSVPYNYRDSPYQGDPKPEVNGVGQESMRYSTNRSPTTTIGTAAL